ncbi:MULTISPECIES: hypothetical protein [unclassified Streptomyces]|uniref:hypothetical protein n=1 Tax=unclassified Streptomyces TaxID=2593676 RepID=UPI00093C9AB1|nr:MULTISPECIES: hypothetical protein [unclassified Streptomyces]MBP2585467.1 hypothetical protein [Streptomyces sp. PvR006]OKJ62100.1 hypothetical protein AMK27_14510 [Streptomyces sp. CB02009]
MNTYNFHGQVSGSNIGDNGRVEIHQYGTDPASAVAMAARLVQWLREQETAASAVAQAEAVHGELVTAEREGRPADQGRIRSALTAIEPYVTVGSGGLALVQGIAGIVGM